ncbi:MAG: hypothetical protein QM698_11040 [Micropepsaceae bacterium]
MTRTLRETLAMSRRDIMNDPQFDWARNRTVRRRLCIAYVALTALGAVLLGFGTTDRNIWLIAGVALTLPVFILVIGSINASVRGLTDIRTAELDEWQIARRDAMFRLCWWPALLILGSAGYVGAMTGAAPGLKAALAFAAFFLAMYLPTLALAWTYPEEPEP